MKKKSLASSNIPLFCQIAGFFFAFLALISGLSLFYEFFNIIIGIFIKISPSPFLFDLLVSILTFSLLCYLTVGFLRMKKWVHIPLIIVISSFTLLFILSNINQNPYGATRFIPLSIWIGLLYYVHKNKSLFKN